MDASRQETIVYLFRCVPGHITIKVNPSLDNTAATTNLHSYICQLARNQCGNSNSVFIIVDSIVVTEGIGLRLAVRFTFGPIAFVTKPGTGDHMIGAAVEEQRRVTCRDGSGRSITPVVF